VVEDLPPTEYATLEIEQAAVEQTFGEIERPGRKRRRAMAAAVILLLFSGGAGALAFSGREADPAAGGADNTTAADAAAADPDPARSSQPLTIAVDTPSFAMAEPIVDSGPPVAPPENQRVASARTSTTASSQSSGGRSDEEESGLDSADVAVPPSVVPSLSITRPVGLALQSSVQPITEPREPAATTEAPQLRNRDRIGQLLAERYPADLRNRGIGGTTLLTVLVGADGRVESSAVVTSSGSPRLDNAARTVADRMLFERPQGASAQAVWVSVPLTFDPQ
jgi:protein TonB